jgi:hypothetical protein
MVPYDFLELLPHLVCHGPLVHTSFKLAAGHLAEAKVPHKMVAQGVDPAGVRTNMGLCATCAPKPNPPQVQPPLQLKQSMGRSQLVSRASGHCHHWLHSDNCNPPTPPPQEEISREVNTHICAREKDWRASGTDLVGLKTNTGLPPGHMHALTLPPQGEEGKVHMLGCHPIQPDSLGTAVMPATAKAIHKKGQACIQSHQPLHQKGMRGKINACRHRYLGGGVTGHRGRPGQKGSPVPGMEEGGSALPKPHTQPHFMPKPDQPSPCSLFKVMFPKNH